MNILQTIEDLLRGEISLIRLMRENMPDTNDLCSSTTNETITPQNMAFDLQSQLPTSLGIIQDRNNPPQMQNGDLAEADQSRLELEDEEEGAVGGAINIPEECNPNNNTVQVI